MSDAPANAHANADGTAIAQTLQQRQPLHRRTSSADRFVAFERASDDDDKNDVFFVVVVDGCRQVQALLNNSPSSSTRPGSISPALHTITPVPFTSLLPQTAAPHTTSATNNSQMRQSHSTPSLTAPIYQPTDEERRIVNAIVDGSLKPLPSDAQRALAQPNVSDASAVNNDIANGNFTIIILSYLNCLFNYVFFDYLFIDLFYHLIRKYILFVFFVTNFTNSFDFNSTIHKCTNNK
jgi:hypothetical protein